MNTPSWKPIQLKEHTCKQGHYGDIAPKLPMRSMLVGPSGSGKTVLLTNTILDIYKGCFPRIYIWSPSFEVDNTWRPVKDYIRDHIKPNDRETCYFDSYDPAELEQVINTQKIQIIRKNRNIKIYIRYWLWSMILPMIRILHESTNYYTSYILDVVITWSVPSRAHRFISNYRQSWGRVWPVFIYRWIDYGDLESIVEELSAVYDKKTILQIYHEAVDEPYSILYVNLIQKDKRKMLMTRFEHYLNPS